MTATKPKVIIRYADETIGAYTLHRSIVPRRGGILQLAPGQSQDGYGKKITTDIMLQFVGEKKRYRVYCTCYSNNGSNWITYKGETLHLRTHFQDEILPD
jgi:hypothetical protein